MSTSIDNIHSKLIKNLWPWYKIDLLLFYKKNKIKINYTMLYIISREKIFNMLKSTKIEWRQVQTLWILHIIFTNICFISDLYKKTTGNQVISIKLRSDSQKHNALFWSSHIYIHNDQQYKNRDLWSRMTWTKTKIFNKIREEIQRWI